MVTNTFAEYTDEQLIHKVKLESSSEAFEVLKERHSGLFMQIVGKYTPHFMQMSGVCYQDVLEDKISLLYNAIMSYDKDKGAQFNTWFGNKVTFYCRNTINANKVQRFETANPEDMIEFIDSIASYKPDNSYSEEAKMIFSILDGHSDPRLSRIFYMRFYLPKPQNSFNNIAKEMGLSVQGTINLYRKAKKFLSQNSALKQLIK
jgi:hypothetical protein